MSRWEPVDNPGRVEGPASSTSATGWVAHVYLQRKHSPLGWFHVHVLWFMLLVGRIGEEEALHVTRPRPPMGPGREQRAKERDGAMTDERPTIRRDPV